MTGLSPLLLDTHAFIWARTEPSRLTRAVRELLERTEHVYVSAGSAWETGIKVKAGKLKLPEPFEAGVEASRFFKLNITFEHVQEAAALPLHHKDPFDRLLVAQARIEKLTLVTRDAAMQAYDVPILVA